MSCIRIPIRLDSESCLVSSTSVTGLKESCKQTGLNLERNSYTACLPLHGSAFFHPSPPGNRSGGHTRLLSVCLGTAVSVSCDRALSLSVLWHRVSLWLPFWKLQNYIKITSKISVDTFCQECQFSSDSLAFAFKY